MKYKCILCRENKEGYGNNPWPLSDNGRCCDDCNIKVVSARLRLSAIEAEINKRRREDNLK